MEFSDFWGTLLVGILAFQFSLLLWGNWGVGRFLNLLYFLVFGTVLLARGVGGMVWQCSVGRDWGFCNISLGILADCSQQGKGRHLSSSCVGKNNYFLLI